MIRGPRDRKRVDQRTLTLLTVREIQPRSRISSRMIDEPRTIDSGSDPIRECQRIRNPEAVIRPTTKSYLCVVLREAFQTVIGLAIELVNTYDV